MFFPINQFEQYIDEKSLERGLKYFEKGKVEEYTAPMKEKRLKVNGLDAVMKDCYNTMLLPSEMKTAL